MPVARDPSRRQVLAAGAGALGCAAVPGRPPVTSGIDLTAEVDVHCHTFCSADLPIVGFVAHYIPGLTELSKLVTRWPELAVRALLGVIARLPNAVAPTGEAELASLQTLLATPTGPAVTGVAPLPLELLDQLLATVAAQLPFAIGADKQKLVARYLDTLYLAAHPRAAIAATLAETYRTVGLFTPALVDYDAWSTIARQRHSPRRSSSRRRSRACRLQVA